MNTSDSEPPIFVDELGRDVTEERLAALKREPIVYTTNRVGRNEKCRCGSRIKSKHCHGRLVRL